MVPGEPPSTSHNNQRNTRLTMNKVYILGAGASRELKFITSTTDISTKESKDTIHNIKGPLSGGFFYYANKFMEDISKQNFLGSKASISNPWLDNYVLSYYLKTNGIRATIEELYNDEAKSKKLNIENLYIELEDKINEIEENNDSGFPTNEEVDAFLGERDLLRYIHSVLSTIAYYCHSIHHRVLANYLISTGGTIISFNWDILFDEEMYATRRWDYSDGYGFCARGFVDKNKFMGLKNYEYTKRENPSKNFILKPHGSLNWYKKSEAGNYEFVDDPNDIYIGVPMTRDGAFKGGTLGNQGKLRFMEMDRDGKEQFESLILPPGKKRKKFGDIWKQIVTLLEEADEIISIGFSFNEFDSHIIEEFDDIQFKKDLVIKIINPDPKIIDKYKSIFKTTHIKKIADSFHEYCRSLVKEKGFDSLASLLRS